MVIEFSGKIWFWRGLAPWYFVTVQENQSLDLKAISGYVTHGWGVIPVNVRIGKTEWKTSLFPKDGHYIVPIRASVLIHPLFFVTILRIEIPYIK